MTRRRHKRSYTAEQKARILDAFFRALALGWSEVRFARLARVPRTTVKAWLLEDGVFARYRRAMEQKALSLPSQCDDIVAKLIKGDMEPKVAGVALRHLEFRLMREFKGGVYQTQKTINQRQVTDMTDEEINERWEELRRKATTNAEIDAENQTRH